MASFALALTRKVTFQLRPTDWPDEIVTYGFHTEEPDSNAVLAQAFVDWWTSDLPILGKARVGLEKVSVAEWLGTPVKKWTTTHQSLFAPVIAGSTQGIAPPQCSIVMSQQTADIPVPLGDGSRRNRTYIGYLADSFNADGTMVTVNQQLVLDSMIALDSRLQLVPRFAKVGRGGLCVTSIQENLSGDTNVFRVGRVVDTQRRRRNAISENYVAAVPV